MDALENLGPSSKLSGGPRPWASGATAMGVVATYLLTSDLPGDDMAAMALYVELSREAIQGSDQAYWLGEHRVLTDYCDYLADELFDGGSVKTWDEWQADLGDSRCV